MWSRVTYMTSSRTKQKMHKRNIDHEPLENGFEGLLFALGWWVFKPWPVPVNCWVCLCGWWGGGVCICVWGMLPTSCPWRAILFHPLIMPQKERRIVLSEADITGERSTICSYTLHLPYTLYTNTLFTNTHAWPRLTQRTPSFYHEPYHTYDTFINCSSNFGVHTDITTKWDNAKSRNAVDDRSVHKEHIKFKVCVWLAKY